MPNSKDKIDSVDREDFIGFAGAPDGYNLRTGESFEWERTPAAAAERVAAMEAVCEVAARLRQLHRELVARPLTYEEFKALMADGVTLTTALDDALARLDAAPAPDQAVLQKDGDS